MAWRLLIPAAMTRAILTLVVAGAVGCGSASRSDSPQTGSGSATAADADGGATSPGSTGGSGPSDSAAETPITADDSSSTAPGDSSGDTEGSASGSTGSQETSGGGSDESSSSGTTGGFDGVIDVTIFANDDCTITTQPASISVPEGTEFTVNWINAAGSDVEVDVAKIDPFNHVPIILGLEPGSAYHDEIREWCGTLFTGTFDFRITSCFDPHYIPVDCSA